MTIDELNNYIKHYLENDKTHSAIMLTGEWGSGKTYYVEHELMNFLEDNNKNKCIVVSLYGVNDISDISKSIYMETRTKMLIKSTEARENVKLFAKTVAKGIVGTFGIDINISEEDLQKVYSSVDLSGKLLILEDLERSGVEITQLLGYVNNLVERDNVKVLLIANENEIVYKENKMFDFSFTPVRKMETNKEEEKNNVTDEKGKYLRIKEKTISDTIYFSCDYYKAVENIIYSFNNKKLKEIIEKDIIENIASMVEGYCNKNLRTFLFATQKTVDILDKMEGNYEKDFLICIYFGIIHFSSMIKVGNFPQWEGTEFLSTILGTSDYPLFRFCYDYMRWQKIDLSQLSKTLDSYNNLKLYDEKASRDDKDLKVLYGYYERTEDEVRKALESIEERLNNVDSIGFYNYGKLAAYLVSVSRVMEFDYTQCKNRMIDNIRGKGKNIDSDLLFLPIYELEECEKKELDVFVKQLSESMDISEKQDIFSYNPNDICGLYDYVIKEKNRISLRHKFISEYNAEKLVEMLLHSSSKQIHSFRGVLFAVYRYANKDDFVQEDCNVMKEILRMVQDKIESKDCNIDKIQIKQLNWLCDNLRTFISQMS